MSLKDFTKDLHEEAEKNPFAQRLLSGNISIDEYACYLTNLEPIYAAIENISQNRNVLVGIESIKRLALLQADLVELKELGATHCVLLQSTIQYVDYLNQIQDNQILAHLYTRHFGDLYGGQILKTKVPGSGKMYEFDDRKALIEKTRMMLSDALGEESRVAFKYAISLFNDLSSEFSI